MRLHTNLKHQRANVQAVSFTPALALRFGIMQVWLKGVNRGIQGTYGKLCAGGRFENEFFLRKVPVMLTSNPSESWD